MKYKPASIRQHHMQVAKEIPVVRYSIPVPVSPRIGPLIGKVSAVPYFPLKIEVAAVGFDRVLKSNCNPIMVVPLLCAVIEEISLVASTGSV